MQSDMKMQDVMNLKNYLYACVQWINIRHYVRKHENAICYYKFRNYANAKGHPYECMVDIMECEM